MDQVAETQPMPRYYDDGPLWWNHTWIELKLRHLPDVLRAALANTSPATSKRNRVRTNCLRNFCFCSSLLGTLLLAMCIQMAADHQVLQMQASRTTINACCLAHEGVKSFLPLLRAGVSFAFGLQADTLSFRLWRFGRRFAFF